MSFFNSHLKRTTIHGTDRPRKTASPPASKSDTFVNTIFSGRHPSPDYNANKNNKRQNKLQNRLCRAYWKICTSGRLSLSSMHCTKNLPIFSSVRPPQTRVNLQRGPRCFPQGVVSYSKRRCRFSNDNVRNTQTKEPKVFLFHSQFNLYITVPNGQQCTCLSPLGKFIPIYFILMMLL